jgi:hypothetical protein
MAIFKEKIGLWGDTRVLLDPKKPFVILVP